MARIFTDGAEFGDLLFFSVVSGPFIISSFYVRTGLYSYRAAAGTYGQKQFSSLSEAYYRFSIAFDNLACTDFFKWLSSSTELGSLRRNNSTGKIDVYVGTSTYVASSTINPTLGTIYLIEVYIKIADSGGVIQVKIDGVLDITFTGDTKPGANTTFDTVRYYGGSQYWYFDDLAMNDTTGSVDNSWCGDGKVILLKPNANGDSSQWDGSDGNQVDNYLLVDDIPSDDDPTYVQSAILANKDLYNLAASGLSDVAILRVFGEARARDLVAEGQKAALVLKTNGGVYEGPGNSLLTSYNRIVGPVYRLNPQSGLEWSVAELDAAQVGPMVGGTVASDTLAYLEGS